jgi:hypothetical protein
LTLDVDRLAGEEVVAAAVVEMQVRIDDDVDPGEVEALLAQGDEAGIHVCHRRMQLRHAGVDQHAPIGMVDDVHGDRHPLALGEQVSNADRRHGDRRGGDHRATRAVAARSIASSHPGTPSMNPSRISSDSRSDNRIVTRVLPSRSCSVTVSVNSTIPPNSPMNIEAR